MAVFPPDERVLFHGEHHRISRVEDPDRPRQTLLLIRFLGREETTGLHLQEHVLSQVGEVSGIPHLVRIIPEENAVLYRDEGGTVLAETLCEWAGSPARTARLGAHLAQVLAQAHRAGVTHRAVNPGNILIAGDGRRPLLLGFGLIEETGDDVEPTCPPGGDLAFLAPEQTDRTEFPHDHRVDLYGLGATMYATLSGIPPHDEDAVDPLTREAVPLISVRPDIPEPLSAVVSRLLRTDPRERYQSAQGAAQDLSRIADQLEARTVTEDLAVGEDALPPWIPPPDRLRGREEELAVLSDALICAPGGAVGGLLVTGASGTGKTALTRRLRPMVAAVGGRCVMGTFDQDRVCPDDDALARTMRRIAQLILTEPEPVLAEFRHRLSAALGPLSRSLADVPGLAAVLEAGPQPTQRDPVDSADHLRQALVTFLRTVAAPERPLVLILDNLHGAPEYALNVIDTLLTEQPVPGLLIVGAFRDTEVDPGHPLAAMLRRWEQAESIPTLSLGPLSDQDLSEFLVDMLRLPAHRAERLAGALTARTRGNPLDTVEFVNALRQDDVLQLADGGWLWTDEAVRTYIGTHTVVDPLDQRVEALARPTRHLLRVLANLGGLATFDRLAVAMNQPVETVRSWAESALRDQLILAADPDEIPDRDGVRFRHDRVRRAAGIGPGAVGDRCLSRTLARRLAAHPRHEQAAAEQYVRAADEVRDPAERRRAAELFLRAAGESQRTDGTAAECYLAAATATGSVQEIDDEDPFAGAVLRLRHAVLTGLGRWTEADDLYHRIVGHPEAPGGQLETDCRQLTSLTRRHRTVEAMSLAMRLLGDVGVPAPSRDQMARDTVEGLSQIRHWILTTSPTTPHRATLSDPQSQVTALILNRMSSAALSSGDLGVLAWTAVRAHRIWTEHGPHPDLLGPLAGCGPAAVDLLGDYQLGYQVMRRVLPYAEAHRLDPAASRAVLWFGLFSNGWVAPAESTLDLITRAKEGCLRGGDRYGAGYGALYEAVSTIHVAPTLTLVEQALAGAREFIGRTGNDAALVPLSAHEDLVRVLRGGTTVPGNVHVTGLDEDPGDRMMTEGTSRTEYYTCRALSALIFGKLEALVPNATLADASVSATSAMPTTFLARLLHGLALAFQLRAGSSDQSSSARIAELDDCCSWAAARAADSPSELGPLSRFLDAERARAVGDSRGAAKGYDAALRTLARNSWPWIHAVLRERAADLFREQGLDHLGKGLLIEAYQRYRSWGAHGKVRQLEETFPFLRSGVERVGTPSSTGTGLTSRSHPTDLIAVLRATRALSVETDPDRLRERVVDVLGMVTEASLTRVAWWDEDRREWRFPVAREPGTPSATEDGSRPDLLDPEEASHRGLLSLTAFRHAERTREPLVVEDATTDDRFAGDPYVQRLDRCSLLVVPVLARGMPRAMLLMENHLIAGAFHQDLVDITGVIAGQLVASLDTIEAARWRTLVRKSTDLTLVCDLRGRIDCVSDACPEVLGAPRNSVVGTTVTELFHEDDRESLRQWLSSIPELPDSFVAKRAYPGSGVRVRPGPDGPDPPPELRWIELTGTDLSDDPTVGGLVLRLRDVTDQRRWDAEQRQAQKRESIGRLAAGVAHELNTPIQFIQDNVVFLQEAFTDLRQALLREARTDEERAEQVDHGLTDLLEEIPQALSETFDGAESMASVVQAMKAFRRPGNTSLSDVDLNAAVRHTVAIAADDLRDVAEIHLDLDPDLPEVSCRAAEINQALLNIIVNAAEAMVAEKQISGRSGTLTVRTRWDGPEAVVEIRDTGAGIAPRIADLVFDQFFTTRPAGAGTGQGLFLARTFVRDHHHGSITFTSSPAEGTTFTVRLPLVQGTSDPDESSCPRTPPEGTFGSQTPPGGTLVPMVTGVENENHFHELPTSEPSPAPRGSWRPPSCPSRDPVVRMWEQHLLGGGLRRRQQ